MRPATPGHEPSGVRGTLTAICIYPIKGARGISLPTARVCPLGLEHDRRWMLVDPDGGFITQRSDPALARLAVGLDGEELVVTTDDRPPLRIRPQPDTPAITVQVHADRLQAHPTQGPADGWFSNWLGYPVRLVWCPENTDRHVAAAFGGSRHRIAFSDDFPFLLTSEESLADLNRRLASPVPMNRFRPNLVIAGTEAYEEDIWSAVRIGGVPFETTKRTGRCLVITTDQQTGRRGREPLETLAGYRTIEGRVRFGRNLVQLGVGRLTVGDAVTVEAVAS